VRQRILEQFRQRRGFDVLILSPDVAGLGLTIVEANHVIHYGRWWNPAKELQATDRAYRIGQEREVFVYYPVASDPMGRIRSFDQLLDDLLRRRKELAREFLRPGAGEDELSNELADALFSGVNEAPTAPRVLDETDIAGLLTWGTIILATPEPRSGAVSSYPGRAARRR
jgi:hypothetical protein